MKRICFLFGTRIYILVFTEGMQNVPCRHQPSATCSFWGEPGDMEKGKGYYSELAIHGGPLSKNRGKNPRPKILWAFFRRRRSRGNVAHYREKKNCWERCPFCEKLTSLSTMPSRVCCVCASRLVRRWRTQKEVNETNDRRKRRSGRSSQGSGPVTIRGRNLYRPKGTWVRREWP